jgi:hypothetical protein
MPQTATLNRQQLFDVVWAGPATEVAKDLGVSSVVIGKTCLLCVPLEVVQKVTGHLTAQIVLKHYFQPAREDLRRVLTEKLPPLLGGGTGPIRTDLLSCA